ncbi:MAG: hypothetical protein Q9201_000138 [Fulgogasparrea decipioides]
MHVRLLQTSRRGSSLTKSQDTKLADRTAVTDAQVNPSDRVLAEGKPGPIKPPKVTSSPALAQPASDVEALLITRRDLSEAQRSRGIIQSRLDDVSGGLQRIKLQSAIDKKRLEELTSEKATLALRLKDRDEELRGKAKLLEAVHDETVSLTLQLNMAEDQARNLKQENENLVKRWMDRMGKEADAMNEASKFT